jgi:hypothetical protein
VEVLTMTTTWSCWITLTGIAFSGLGCSGQPARSYGPDAVDAVETEVAYAHRRRSQPVEPALVWLVDEAETGGDTLFVGFTIDVRGRFPSRFRLRLTDPPPPEAFFRAKGFLDLVGDSGLEMAIGTVSAARVGLLTEDPTSLPPDVVNDREFFPGEVEEFELVFLNQDVEPGPVSDEVFGGRTPSAGYHLLSSEDREDAPDGLNTRLRIVLSDPI